MLHLVRLGVSLRSRLTLWYGALLAVTLIGFSALLYFTLERSLATTVDDGLHLRADQITRSVLGPNVGLLLQPEDVPPGQVEAPPLEEFAAPGIYVQVLNARGAVVSAPSNLVGGQLPVTPASLESMRSGVEHLGTVQAGDANVRVLTVPLRARGAVVGAVQVGQSLAPFEGTMAAVSRLLLFVGLVALLLAMVVGWLLTRAALRPLARVTETARLIAATGDYSRRLQVVRPQPGTGDELYSLASTFDDMIARLEHVLESQRRLLADTSHELRNPLTVIRGNLALLRRESVPDGTRREAAQEADEEAARMGRLVNDLLLLARADAGQLPSMPLDRVDVPALVREVVDQARPRAGARTLEVIVAHPATVGGDRDRLKQLLANLVENAIRYTPEGGRICATVTVESPSDPVLQRTGVPGRSQAVAHRTPAEAVISIADSGIGIASKDLPHLFERFYRADKARSRAEGGSGLGLPIAQYVAQAHGGRVEARSDGLGRGATFVVRLPLREPPRAPASSVQSSLEVATAPLPPAVRAAPAEGSAL